ncbi:hypothetical protein B0H16DRAFT_1578683 [Mycena metata]|uniref:Uncharacterized protein n=1 Tax=Mycena metata TaxID=1033252 RepID=A0AAD7I4I8_9AGAR|nr:hypothetical protein B0H16DRAFT_1578683 [Mycena metata]
MSSKTLTFYTSLSSATKRLRSPIQIVLTLSLDPLKPVVRRNTEEPHAEKTAESQLPIAWQVLQFDLPSSSQNLSVDYGEAFAAMEVESTINGVYQPGSSYSSNVETGKLVKYTGSVWSGDTLYTPGPPLGHFTIQNDAARPVEMVLGSYSPGEQDAQQPYIPVVFLGPLSSGCEFHCTKPVYLQAYTTVNHRRGQRLARSVVEEMFLFKDSTGKPKAKLLTDIKRKCAFQVYSNYNGEIALEMTVNQD